MAIKFPKWLSFNAKQRKIIIPTILGLLVTLGFYAADVAKPQSIERVANLLFDHYQRQNPREYKPEIPVRIIDIDDESLRRLGQWPWPRSLMAKFNDRLADAGAAVVSYDVVFSEPDRTSPENIIEFLKANPKAEGEFENVAALRGHDQLLADAFGRTQVVAGFFFVGQDTGVKPKLSGKFSWSGSAPTKEVKDFPGSIIPLPVLEAQAAGEGFVNFEPKADGIIREAPLVFRMGTDFYRSLALETIRVVFRQGGIVVRMSNGFGELDAVDSERVQIAGVKVADLEFPTLADGSFRVYFSKPNPEARYIPAWKILSDEIPMSDWANKIQGNIVFVGTGAIGLKDIVATPIRGGEPGVIVHAQIVEQILGQQFLTRTYKMSRMENLFLIISGLLLAFGLPRLGATKGAILSLIIVGAVAYGSWYGFKNHLMLINPIYILLAVLTSYLLMTLTSFYLTEVERSRIRGAFSMYLSPTMVKKVSEDPDLLTLGGEERQMTILFLDIRGFSKISEGLQPEEITTFLNIFLTPMTNILQDHHATIDKYIGDAIVAFWNAPLDDPDHEQNAANCVMEMLRTLDQLNETYMAQSDIKWPQNVRMGIGLNTGVCCVGNLGSEQRFSYSMIGDAANLASRIEGLTKQYKTHVLVGDSTAQKLGDYALVEADLIRVVGRQTPERIYILAGDEAQANTQEFQTLKPLHTKFLAAHRAQNWDEARALIPELQRLSHGMEFDGYYDVMSDRMDEYEANPPAQDWGGIYVATSK